MDGGASESDTSEVNDLESLERIRRRNLPVERTLRGWGKGLVFAAGLFALLSLVRAGSGAAQGLTPLGEAGSLARSLSIAFLLILTGRLLWRLHPLAQVQVVVVCALYLPSILFSGAEVLTFFSRLAVAGIPSVLAWAPQGQAVFSEHYRKVVMPATAHVRPGSKP